MFPSPVELNELVEFHVEICSVAGCKSGNLTRIFSVRNEAISETRNFASSVQERGNNERKLSRDEFSTSRQGARRLKRPIKMQHPRGNLDSFIRNLLDALRWTPSVIFLNLLRWNDVPRTSKIFRPKLQYFLSFEWYSNNNNNNNNNKLKNTNNILLYYYILYK